MRILAKQHFRSEPILVLVCCKIHVEIPSISLQSCAHLTFPYTISLDNPRSSYPTFRVFQRLQDSLVSALCGSRHLWTQQICSWRMVSRSIESAQLFRAKRFAICVWATTFDKQLSHDNRLFERILSILSGQGHCSSIAHTFIAN